MIDSAHAWRRWFSVLFLAVAFAMLTWGQTLLKPYLTGNALFAYWLLFLAFTSGTVAIGLLDFFAVRRFFKSEQARVAQQAQRLAAMRANQHRGGPSPDSHATPSSGSK